MTARERVIRVLSEVLSIPEEQITENFSPSVTDKWSSLAQLSVIMALEEEFQIHFTDAETADLISLKMIVENLRAKNIN